MTYASSLQRTFCLVTGEGKYCNAIRGHGIEIVHPNADNLFEKLSMADVILINRALEYIPPYRRVADLFGSEHFVLNLIHQFNGHDKAITFVSNITNKELHHTVPVPSNDELILFIRQNVPSFHKSYYDDWVKFKSTCQPTIVRSKKAKK